MPIFSRNSLGSDVKITANENYSYADMGRILSECVQNDMTLFNAVLMNDFKENAAIREGTMVASELTSFREFSVKEAWGGLKKKLQKLWEKIKGVFRQVYAKLTVWFVRNGKAFVAANRKILANKTGLDKCKIPVYLKQKKKPVDVAKTIYKYASDTVDSIKGGTSKEYELNEVLGKLNDSTTETFAKNFHDAVFDEVKDTTYASVEKYEQLFAVITGKKGSMEELKAAEKAADQSIKAALDAIKAAERNADKGADTSAYKTASNNCGVFERAVTITTKAAIKAIRDRISNARQIVGKLVAYSPTNESAVLEEAAWLEGADDFAEVDDIPAEEINADDVKSDPDVEINVTVDDDGNECSK